MKKTIIRIYKICRGFFDRMRANHVDVYSASAAFYMFISLVPLILALFAIVPFTPLTEEMVIDAVEYILPRQFDDFAISLINEVYANRFTILSIAALTAIWSASRGLMSIRRGFDEIFHIMEPYNYVIIRLKSSGYTLFLILVLAAELIFGAFGQYILGLLTRFFPGLPVSGSIGKFYTNLIFILGAFILLVLLYSFLPRKKQKISTQIFGAAVSTLAMVGFSTLFSTFLNYFIDSFSMYGSLATVIILLLWLYVNMYIIFMGAQLNSIFADTLFLKRKLKEQRERSLKGEDFLKAIEEDRLRAENPENNMKTAVTKENLKNIINFRKIIEKKENKENETHDEQSQGGN